VAASGILSEFQKENTPESINRKENVEELLNAIQAFSTGQLDAPGSAPGGEYEQEQNQSPTLDAFMQDIALVSEVDEKDDDTNKVSLMTIHAAKGLEFPFVYVTGLEENLFPNTQMLASKADLEEERRLFYVAVTRAEKNLTLSYSQLRFRWGELTMCEPSRFLDEIDGSLVLQIPRKMSIPVTEHGFSEEENTFTFPPRTSFRSFPPKSQNIFGENVEGRRVRRTSGGAGENLKGKEVKPETQNTRLKPLNSVSQTLNFKSGTSISPNPGMRVEHQKFGIGTVISVEGTGDNAKANIDFDNAGQKMLMLRFAILKEIG
jgi:DNA helicase-2/ATP-dependent DNA helicase PcrA